MDLFQDFSWELSVLAKSVAHKNLSGASLQVGLSQPQLSRIVSKLEGALGVRLLDRATRRTSGWTPAAFRLAELYSKASRHLQADIQKLLGDQRLKVIRIGTLEGLRPAAFKFSRCLFEQLGAQTVELDIFDLNELEESFLKESLEFIFTVRPPGRRKPSYVRHLGYQEIEEKDSGEDFSVVSPFEYASKSKPRSKGQTLISNSLAIRKEWLTQFGGKGVVPSGIQVKQTNHGQQNEVLLIGSEQLNRGFWQRTETFEF